MTVLCATPPLLGELQPLVRQLFVAPLAFLVPAVRELSILSRVRTGLFRPRLTPFAGCGEIHRHGDSPPSTMDEERSAIVAFAP